MQRVLNLQTLTTEATRIDHHVGNSSLSAGLCSSISGGLCSSISGGLCNVAL